MTSALRRGGCRPSPAQPRDHRDTALPCRHSTSRDASRGSAWVVVNGRELNFDDVNVLRTIMVVFPGRYWMEANGWGGHEGGPPMWKVWTLAAHAANRHRGGASVESWVDRGIAGGMSAGGGCIGWVSGSPSTSVGCD